MHQIKKGQSIPGISGRRGAPNIYPLPKMVDGDSFDTEIHEGETEEKAVKRLRNATTSWRMRNNSAMAFSVAAVTDKKGMRVIRVLARMTKPPVPRDDIESFFKPGK